ncbi:MAG: M48 family metallopeptidase [Spirulina sp.]
MNFFEHQDQARRNTTYLVFLFGLSVGLMILAFYFVAIFTVWANVEGGFSWWQPEVLGIVALGTIAVIGAGSGSKMMALREGGAGLAKSLGGRAVTPQTNDPGELRLLNVVAEMALAAGTPIPAVYLLEHESSINAFAAGFSPETAVIGVTKGCLDQLSRDELQGVIGHEFSHIVHGDMGLNLKLIGVLQGLLLIHILGRFILRYGDFGYGRRRSSNSDNKGVAVILIAGLSMAVIGSIGLLCGRLIKSAVSRQREFLADASAVQFTRNPDGLAGALTKLGQLSGGSKIMAPTAEEASHLFFGEALPGVAMFGSWFATHPPLQDRIRRLGKVPNFAQVTVPSHPSTLAEGLVMGLNEAPATAASSAQGRSPQTLAAQAPFPQAPSPQAFMAAIGTIDGRRLAQVQDFLNNLDPALKTALHQPESAREVVFALLLDDQPSVQSQQTQSIAAAYGEDSAQRAIGHRPALQGMDSRQTLPLLELTMPALKPLSVEEKKQFFSTLQALIKADGCLSLSEYVLQLIVRKRLTSDPGTAPSTSEITSLDALWNEAVSLLSLLARMGHTKPEDAFYALKSGLYQLPGAKKQTLPDALPSVKITDLGKSLATLDQATPKLKQAIVDACAHTVLADNTVTPQEGELLRAIVMVLDCPAPPFLA